MDRTEPSESLVEAAVKGERAALTSLSAWYRDRGRPASHRLDSSDEQIAYWLDAYSYELQERHVQARKLRRLLSLLPKGVPAFHPTRHTRLEDLREHASAFGLPLTIRPAQWMPRQNVSGDLTHKEERVPIWGGSIDDKNAEFYLVICPTDGEREEETGRAVKAFFSQHFASFWPIEVRHWNDPLTEAGERACGELGMRE